MEVKAVLRHAKVGNLKAFPVAGLVRGKNVSQAIQLLSVQKKKSAMMLQKLIQSAAANAEKAQSIDVDRLFVKSVCVDRGPHRHSFMPRARGRASAILKKTSHISVVLAEK